MSLLNKVFRVFYDRKEITLSIMFDKNIYFLSFIFDKNALFSSIIFDNMPQLAPRNAKRLFAFKLPMV